MTDDGQPVRAYRVQVQVFAPGGDKPMNQAGVQVAASVVRETSEEGLAEYFRGMLEALAGDVALIVRDHAGGEGVG